MGSPNKIQTKNDCSLNRVLLVRIRSGLTISDQKVLLKIYAEFIHVFHTLYISSTGCNGFEEMSKDKICSKPAGVNQ
jgi:hypothetical protein